MAVELFMITHKTERQILCNHSSILNIEVYLLSLKQLSCVYHMAYVISNVLKDKYTIINQSERKQKKFMTFCKENILSSKGTFLYVTYKYPLKPTARKI